MHVLYIYIYKYRIYTFTYHIFIRRNQTLVFKGKDFIQACKRWFVPSESDHSNSRPVSSKSLSSYRLKKTCRRVTPRMHSTTNRWSKKIPSAPMSFPNLPNIDQHPVQLRLSHTSRRSELRVLTIKKQDWWVFLFKNTCYKQHLQ